MGVVAVLTTLLKGKKKLKTLITVPGNNFQSYNAILNSNDELEITGTDGNGVAFQQTLVAPPNSIVLFDVDTRNFVAVQIQGEFSPSHQLVSIVRTVA